MFESLALPFFYLLHSKKSVSLFCVWVDLQELELVAPDRQHTLLQTLPLALRTTGAGAGCTKASAAFYPTVALQQSMLCSKL
jgi:hypothetical protein